MNMINESPEMAKPTLLDLFSGIGGFSLAFEREGFRTIGFSEINPWASAVLRKHWPDVRNYGDIRNIGNLYNKRADVISGGFPCQDISVCGDGLGLAGARSSLWFWMYEIIKRNKPRFCLIENVPALRTRGADTVLTDLEKAGYAARPFVVEACAAGADQARERVWIVAYLGRVRNPRHVKGCDSGEMRPRREGCEADLQPTNWRTRPIFDSSPSPILCRRNDGVSARVDRIRCLGNSIVPQVAQIFARFIYQCLRPVPDEAAKPE